MEHQQLYDQVKRLQEIVDILHKSWKLNPYKTEDIDMNTNIKASMNKDMTKERKMDN